MEEWNCSAIALAEADMFGEENEYLRGDTSLNNLLATRFPPQARAKTG
jgi:hypothetical protein